MKSLKFKPYLIPPILAGEKTVTLRLFDDKDLAKDDEVTFVNNETGEPFTVAVLTEVVEKELGSIEVGSLKGLHAPYHTKDEMFRQLASYYGKLVTLGTLVKIITFAVKKK